MDAVITLFVALFAIVISATLGYELGYREGWMRFFRDVHGPANITVTRVEVNE